MSAFQTEQRKVAELEGALSSLMKTMEIEYSKLQNANKVSLHVIHFAIDNYILTKLFLPST